MYPDTVTFYQAETGGAYNAAREWVPGSPAAEAWSGKVDLQDEVRRERRDREGNLLAAYDAVIYFSERQEETALAVVKPGMTVTTPLGKGRVTGVQHLDGRVFVEWMR